MSYFKDLDILYNESIAKPEKPLVARRVSKKASDKQPVRRSVVAKRNQAILAAKTKSINKRIIYCVLDEAINNVVLANMLAKRKRAVLAWKFPWSKGKGNSEDANSGQNKEYASQLQQAYDDVYDELSNCKSLVQVRQLCDPKRSSGDKIEQQIKTQFFKILYDYAVRMAANIASIDSSAEVNENSDFKKAENWQELEDSIYIHFDAKPAQQVKYFLDKIGQHKHNILQDMPGYQRIRAA